MTKETIQQLAERGIVRNPHMYIGDGFMYCPNCETYTHHDAYSTEGKSDCYEVCQGCACYIDSSQRR